MADYTSTIALAKRLIESKGRPGVLLQRRGVQTASDPDRPWRPDAGPDGLETLATATIVFLDVIRTRSGEAVVAESTASAYLAADSLPNGVAPKDGDVLTVPSGARFAALRVDTLAPSGDPILYTLHLKG